MDRNALNVSMLANANGTIYLKVPLWLMMRSSHHMLLTWIFPMSTTHPTLMPYKHGIGTSSDSLNHLMQPEPENVATTCEGNTQQCRQPGHSRGRCVSFVCTYGIMGYCAPSIAHMTLGNLAVKNKWTLISFAVCGKPMCCSSRCAVDISTPDSTRVSLTSLLYMPPSAEKTQRPRDEESAKFWAARGCHDSSWSVTLNYFRNAWLGNMYLHVISSFIWYRVTQTFPCLHERSFFMQKMNLSMVSGKRKQWEIIFFAFPSSLRQSHFTS